MRYAAVVVLFLAVRLSAQTTAPAPVEESRFDVASVKPSQSTFGGFYNPQPTRFTTTGSVVEMLSLAHQLQNFRIVGGAEWTRRERFDINAAISGPRRSGDFRFMLRHLLADRFALRVHQEERPVEVYALRKARADGRLGPNLKQMERDCGDAAQSSKAGCRMDLGPSLALAGVRWETRTFVGYLERAVGRPVLDETGLSGQFDVTLTFNPDVSRPVDAVPGVSSADVDDRPSLFTALREQLGLKLEPTTAKMNVLVIDSVERPKPD